MPVVSYLVLRGRCRHCGVRISPRYPLVELLTGLLFFYQVYTHGETLEAVKLCAFSAITLALLFCDLEKRLLPDELTKGGIVLGLVFAAFVKLPGFVADLFLILAHAHWNDRARSIAESAIGAGLPALVLWFAGWVYFRVRHREGLGFGDVKLIAMVGSFLGFPGALLTLLMGSFAGSVIGYGYIKLTGKDSETYELPFGSFLAAAALIAAAFGNKILPM
jgi:leader peptidase (prepilin peptidase)/N-methyltransferase